jgi:hypothetical protein
VNSKSFSNEISQEDYLAKIKEEPEFFRNIDPSILNDKDFVLKAIDVLPTGQAYLFRRLSENLKDDKDVVLKIVAKSYTCMEFISYRLMSDKEVALVCLKQKGSSLSYLSYTLVNELAEYNICDKQDAIKYLEKFVLKEELHKDLSSKQGQAKKMKI